MVESRTSRKEAVKIKIGSVNTAVGKEMSKILFRKYSDAI